MLKIVGVGICDGQITERAAKIISEAEVVFGSKRAISLASKYIRGKIFEIKKFEKEVYSEIEKIGAEKNVVVLSTGDPMVAGLGSKIRGTVEPGISSVQMALAKVKEDLCNVVVIDAHAKSAENEFDLIDRKNLLILADKNFDPSVFGKKRAALIENICGNERFVLGRAEDLEIRSDYVIVFVWR
ncbi:MAG: SAM-dependent methyltransferase [Archaeoglobaceae archaeon]|nr:SAM-dependent methyltransferase [Archaeoglobaceae archaeon]MCX8152502.1 SAM-dependent methyltransferase [Archaeoglobaceae archaeon]MDW8013683.1 SAM-dependent methyltransferase [Archaeoglobaceae archaeon]